MVRAKVSISSASDQDLTPSKNLPKYITHMESHNKGSNKEKSEVFCIAYPSISPEKTDKMNQELGTKPTVYKRRFWALILFSTCSMLSGMMWPQYAITAAVSSCYYDVSENAIFWTTLIYLVMYIPLIFPVSWFMDYFGLRKTVIAGAFFNVTCSIIQCLSLEPDGFPMVMVSQTFGSLSNVFVLGVPPFLAALWFPAEEVSRACAVGVFGNQMGVALGFIYLPLLMPTDCSNKPAIAYGKSIGAYILTGVNLLILGLVLFTFQDKPKTPPSLTQQKKKDVQISYRNSIKNLIMNKHFDYLLLANGLINGVYFTIATVLNTLVLKHFPGKDVEVGWMGLLMVLTGMVGSIIAGYILDYTHRFKETSIGIFIFSLLSMVIFTVLLEYGAFWVQFLTLGILGFFLTSYIPVGFEYGSELTYPESEAIAAGLLNTSAMLVGTVFILACSKFLEIYSSLPTNLFMCAGLLLGCIATVFIKGECRRVKENEQKEKTTEEIITDESQTTTDEITPP